MIYFYRSKKFRNALKDEPTILKVVENKLASLEQRKQLLETKKTLKEYDKSDLIWVLRGYRNTLYRVIIQGIKKEVHGESDHDLFVIRDYIPASKYEPYWRRRLEPMISQRKYLLNYPIDSDDLTVAIKEFHEHVAVKKEYKPDLPPHMRDWLQDFSVDQNFSIYESPNWPKRDYDSEKYYHSLYQLIHAVITGSTENYKFEQHNLHGRQIAAISDDMVCVVYEHTQNNSNDHIFLHSWSKNNSDNCKSNITSAINYLNFQGYELKTFSKEIITKGAYRGYPSTMFHQPNGYLTWNNIQSNSAKSNLALAPEQEALLRQCYFPRFINGQAGSGKSEMLMYIFAELCYLKTYWNTEGVELDIAFLTENKELLERARYDTHEKLQNNTAYQGYPLPDAKELTRYFYKFIDFVRELLPIELKLNFDPVDYINFARFKKLYESSGIEYYIKKDNPAEIVWYVIMTYIRGYDSTIDEFGPDDFDRLTRKQSAYIYVDKQRFNVIYDRIWDKWYKRFLDENNMWDRLSLVRHVLELYEQIPAENKYDIIVCDEAQDFTKVELELLVMLSKYGDYQLQETDNQIPILFAGDPFQTVSPTGFNLVQMKQIMYEIIEKRYGAKIERDKFITDLKNNYRSTPEIVNTANIIQYVRRKCLGNTELDIPQESMNRKSENIPQLIELRPFDLESLANKLDNCIFLLPCNLGEEIEYKDNDNFLKNKEFVLKSASLAKGSEYPEVVLYKFGQQYVDEFGSELFENLLNYEYYYGRLDPGTQFKLNYFFNKLYVGITRAREQLYIIDSREGINNFWHKFEQSKNFIVIEDANWQSIKIHECFTNSNISKLGDINPLSLLKSAHEDEENGILLESPRRLQDAISSYKKYQHKKGSNQEKRINKCRAYKSKFEGDFLEAFELFQMCSAEDGFDPILESSDCLWLGEKWRELIEYHKSLVQTRYKELFRLRTAVARIVSNDSFDIQNLLNYKKKLEGIVIDHEYADKLTWRETFYRQLIRLVRERISEFAGKHLELARILHSFKYESEDFSKLIAELYFEGNDFQSAMDCWSDAEFVDHRKYWKCGAEVHKKGNRSEEIFYLDKLGDNNTILDNYHNGRYTEIGITSYDILLNHLLSENESYETDIIKMNTDNERWKSTFNIFEKDHYNKIISFHDKLAQHVINEFETKGENRNFPYQLYLNHVATIIYKEDKDSILKLNIYKETKNNKDLGVLYEAKLNKLLDGYNVITNTFINCIKIIIRIQLNIEIIQDEILTMFRNLFVYLSIDLKRKLTPIESLAFIEQCIPKYIDKMYLVAQVENFLLTDNLIARSERDLIEDRFWKYRFDLKNRNNSEGQLKSLLDEAFIRYPNAGLNRKRPSIEQLKNEPSKYSYSDLIELLEARQAYDTIEREPDENLINNENIVEKERISARKVRQEESDIRRNNIQVTGAKAGDIVGGPLKGTNVREAIKGARFLLLSDSKKGQTGNMIAYFRILDPGRGSAEEVLADYMEKDKVSAKEILNDKRVSNTSQLFYTNRLIKLA